jgi:radical SAM superfamily enzyme YgiQ (UPF0313 family)
VNICLVTAPTATEFEGLDELSSKSVRWAASQPQLGILSLAAVLLGRGDDARIVDLNRAYFDWAESVAGMDSVGFAEFAASTIAARVADIYGFGSICSSYPLTIRIAEAVKVRRPESAILFGGPQASVVDVAILEAFPFVDLVLRGEAERSLPVLLDQLQDERRLDRVPGLTYRTGARPCRNPNAPVIESLDDLPTPAYHLTRDLQDATKAALELGRGCPYACTFCSTNDFFRRKFRLRSPERVLQDMRRIAAEYGIRDFELVHDMFTIDRRRVAEFCDAMIESGEKFTWSCSARTDSVDEELLELMSRGGCNGIFYGVEVGSRKMQKIIDKHLDPQRADEIIDATERLGIHSTVSMITGFPEETWEDLKQTVGIYMHSARCPNSSPQLNLLAPLAETPLHARYRNELVLEELCSDMSHQGRSQNKADLQLIRKYPDIFPNFYLLPTTHLDHKFLLELREFALNAIDRLRWLVVAIDQTTTGLLDFFSEWREHRLNIRPGLRGSDLRQYYRAPRFRGDFLTFVRQHGIGKHVMVEVFLDYEDALRESAAAATAARPAGELVATGSRLLGSDVPVRREHTMFVELSCDIQRIIDGLKLCREPLWVRGPHFYVAREVSAGTCGVEQVSSWLGCVLRACDGHHSIQEIVTRLASDIPEVEASLRDYVFGRLLEGAQAKGLISIHRMYSSSPQSPDCPKASEEAMRGRPCAPTL